VSDTFWLNRNPQSPITPTQMIKEFVLKFVAALAGVEHNLTRTDDHGNHFGDTIDRVTISNPSAVPYRVVTMQRVPVLSRYSRVTSGLPRDRFSHS